MIRNNKFADIIMNLVTTFALTTCFSTFALCGSMTADIDKTESSTDEPFFITLQVQGSLDDDVKTPETKDFEIQRTGESTNISIVNGTMTKERQYTYQVRALKQGALTIPPFKAKVDHEEMATQSFAVQVKGGHPQEAASPDGSTKLLSVERELPKKTLYEGESLLTVVRLLVRARLTGATPSRDSAPDWRVIGEDGKRQRNTIVTRQGVQWNAIEMNEVLIPLHSGKLKVPPFGIEATWIQPRPQRRPRSIFDMFQNGGLDPGSEVSKKLVSEAKDIVVKPLPSPRPADFYDIVGAFKISSNLSKTTLAVGETSTITIEVKGQGALDRMRELVLSVPGAKLYADKPILSEKIEAGPGLLSTKTFKFAVVPTSTGSIQLGTLKISAFNPYTESYETLSTNVGTITVSGAGDSKAPPVSNATVAPTSTDEPSQSPSTAPLSTVTPAITATTNSPINSGAPTVIAPDLTPKAVTQISEPRRPYWFLSPVGLAFEALIAVLMVIGLLVRRSWSKLTPRNHQSSSRTALLGFDELLREIDAGDSAVIARATQFLKNTLAKEGQNPSAVTSSDLLQSAKSMGIEHDHLLLLAKILTDLDRAAYGATDVSLMRSDFLLDLKTVLIAIHGVLKTSLDADKPSRTV